MCEHPLGTEQNPISKRAGNSSSLDYYWDWTDWLNSVSDSISTNTVAVIRGSGVTASTPGTVAAGVVVSKVTGGVKGEIVVIRNSIVTVGSGPGGVRKDYRDLYLRII